MKSKRKILAIMLVVLAISVAVISSAFADTQTNFKGEKVYSEYGYNSEFVAPLRYVENAGEEYIANSVITFPSGKATSYGRVILDEVGEYSIVYTADVNGTAHSEEYKFDVNIQPKDVWIGDRAEFLTYNNADVSPFNGKGAMLVSAYTKTEVRYANELYLADNTTAEEIITFLVKPLNKDNAEFRTFTVVIEDSSNASNRIYVKFNRASYELAAERYSMNVSVSRDGKLFSSYKTITRSSFCGALASGIDAYPVTVRFDNTSGTIYVESDSQTVEFDLKNEIELGEGNSWKGFTDGWGYVYIGFKDRLTQGASSVAVYSVNGVSLAGDEVVDEQAPEVSIVSDKIKSNTLYGRVNAKHVFPKMKAVCKVEGSLSLAKISVYRTENGVQNTVPSKYDGFTPLEVGEYYVEYETEENYNGVKGKGGYKLVVLSEEECAITYEFANYANDFIAGDYIQILEPVVFTGGRGEKVLTYEVKAGQREVEVLNGKFFAEYPTTYTLTAVITDDVQTVRFDKEITVGANNVKYVDNFAIPRMVMVGDVIDFSLIDAYKFTANGKTKIEVECKVDGNAVSGKYVVASAGEKQITIQGEGVQESFIVTAIAPNTTTTNEYIKSFFNLNSADLSVTSSGMEIKFSEDKTMGLIRPLNHNNLSIAFYVKSSVANFANLEFMLVDSKNSQNAVSFTISKGAEDKAAKSVLTYLGNTYEVAGSLVKNNAQYPFSLIYDKDALALNDANGKVLTFTKTVNGNTFNGFEGDVYLAIRANGVTSGSAIVVKSIGNQSIKTSISQTANNAGPMVAVNGSYGKVAINQTVSIFDAEAHDVLENVESLKVIVTAPDGSEVLNSTLTNGLNFVPTMKGEYNVKYVALDSNGNKTEKVCSLTVIDETEEGFTSGGNSIGTNDVLSPVITIGKKVSSAKVGEKFSLAKITVTDNLTELSDIKLYVYVIAPDGVRTLVSCTPSKIDANDESTAGAKLAQITDVNASALEFTANYSGAYRIYYVATDSNNLTTITYYTVNVQ